jgi:hypothetical protein
MEAPALTGPWKAAQSPPADLKKAEKEARDSMQVDLLEGQPDPDTKAKPSLAALAPQVYVATTPTELIVTDGAPNFVPCGDTRLLYVKNTTAHVFKCMGDQKTYVLLSGRWFRAPSFAGPWEYVPAKSLPPDFAAIPDDSPKENVKAAVPGTPQSKEALIADSIPQTVEVDRAAAKFTPQIDGVPQLKPIEQTPLYYVVNSSAPIIKVNDQSWYACQNGVWFCAPALAGPWTVAASVPPVIYSIPPSSPLYYVTFCRVYGSTDQYVYEGYTPGYLGTTVSDDGVVVYGTGYSYDPWVGTVWYGPPVTYGLGCNICWTPWASWAYGYGFGWIVRPIWTYPPAPWWGPYRGWAYNAYGGITAWGPGGWAATSGNVYHQWGNWGAVTRGAAGYNAFTGNEWASRYGTAYNSRTGAMAAGRSGAVENVYTGNYAKGREGAGYNPNTGIGVAAKGGTIGNVDTGKSVSGKEVKVVNTNTGKTVTAGDIKGADGSAGHVGNDAFATHDGNVYVNKDGGGWHQVTPPEPQRTTSTQDFSQLDRERQARSTGEQRTASFQSARPQGGFQGGGFRGGRR